MIQGRGEKGIQEMSPEGRPVLLQKLCNPQYIYKEKERKKN